MTNETLTPLILDFLEWLAAGARPYSEVMEAWRTSCPRFTIWEDAVDSGFVVRSWDSGNLRVELTDRGRTFLLENRGTIRAS